MIEYKHTNSLVKMETDILGSRVSILTNSIRSLGDAKEAEEKNTLIISNLKREIKDYITNRDKLEYRITELIKERESLHLQLKDMNLARIKALEEKDKFLKYSKERLNFMEGELKVERAQNTKHKEEIDNLRKNLKVSMQEKDFLRERINQMKFKRNININHKICRNCNKDYLEKENFKWS